MRTGLCEQAEEVLGSWGGDMKSSRVCSGSGSGSGSGLTVALPQFDGLVVFQGGRRDDVLRRVAGGGDHHVCGRDTGRRSVT